jgi:hypothetical protein
MTRKMECIRECIIMPTYYKIKKEKKRKKKNTNREKQSLAERRDFELTPAFLLHSPLRILYLLPCVPTLINKTLMNKFWPLSCFVRFYQ